MSRTPQHERQAIRAAFSRRPIDSHACFIACIIQHLASNFYQIFQWEWVKPKLRSSSISFFCAQSAARAPRMAITANHMICCDVTLPSPLAFSVTQKSTRRTRDVLLLPRCAGAVSTNQTYAR